MIVVAYGLILPQTVLDIPRLGCLNVHASLLPRWRGAAPIERALLAGSILFILIVEILNSAVEAVVDKASPEKHELAKRAKDMGSAAVLLSLLNAAVIWACVLWR